MAAYWLAHCVLKQNTQTVPVSSRARGGTPYSGLNGKTLPKRGTFFRLQVYERVGYKSRVQVEAYERVGASII